MSDLIRDYNTKQQENYASNLEIPKIQAPHLQDATPVNDNQLQVTVPQGQPLEQMVAPVPDAQLGALSQQGIQANLTAQQLFNQRLARQLPTLLAGQPTDAERRSNAFYDFINTQIEENRKRNAAQAFLAPGLMSSSNTEPESRPNGFTQNVLKAVFGGEGKTNDGIMGNEFDITKGRFGQYGGGILGGAMYLLDNTLGLAAFRNSLLDTGAGLASQLAGWTAKGGIIDTLFKTGDVGKAIVAGDERYKQGMRNIYGDNWGKGHTSFLMQGLSGRDLGAMGNLAGDTKDDYSKMYGSSPVAAGLDHAFFGRDLTEQESQDFEKLTGYSIKNAAGLKFSDEELADYQQVLSRVPEDLQTKMLLRNLVGLASDIHGDEVLRHIGGIHVPKKVVEPTVIQGEFAEQPQIKGVEPTQQLSGGNQRQLPQGASSPESPTPVKETPRPHADEYMVNALRREQEISVTPKPTTEKPRLAPASRPSDPWVTIEAQPVASSGLPALSPAKEMGATPSLESVLPKVTPPQPTETTLHIPKVETTPLQALPPARTPTSAAKGLVVSPPIDVVTAPVQPNVAVVLRQQYMQRVEPGQFILQRLGTPTDADPLVQYMAKQPAPRVSNPVPIPTSVYPIPQIIGNSKGAQEVLEAYKTKLSEASSLIPKTEVSSQATKTRSALPENVANKITTEKATMPKGEPPIGEPVKAANDVVTKVIEEAQKPKLIPTSKEELLRKARENLQRSKKGEDIKMVDPEAKVDVVKEEPPKVEELKQNAETSKQEMLRKAKERLDAEKAARSNTPKGQVEEALKKGDANPVEGGVEVRAAQTPEGQEFLAKAIDFDQLFNKTYDISELDTMLSMVSRAAAGAPLSFVGKVAPIAEVSRSQKEIYRLASLVPHPTDPSKPLLAPTKSIAAEYLAKYGVPHPYAEHTIADSSMKYLRKSGGARRHKTLDALAAEQTNPLYRKLLSPTGAPVPLGVIEHFEKQMVAKQALIKTSSDTVSIIEKAEPVKDVESIDTKAGTSTATPKEPTMSRKDMHTYIDTNKLGIKKNLGNNKLAELINLHKTKGNAAIPDDVLTKSALDARNNAKSPAAPLKAEEPAKVKVEAKKETKLAEAAKKIVKSETLEDFEESVVKLEDLEPSLKELEEIEKKVSNLPIYDHRKKLSSPSHTEAVIKEAKKTPEIVEQQKAFVEATQGLQEAIVQEQEIVKVQQAVQVAADNVHRTRDATLSKFMDKYGLTRDNAEELYGNIQEMLKRSGEAFPLVVDENSWKPSSKAAHKNIPQTLVHIDDIKTAPNYEALRKASIDSGEYEKAAVWLYENTTLSNSTTKAVNPVVSFSHDGSLTFKSGSSTAFAAMDSMWHEEIPMQILEDLRPPKKEVTPLPTPSKEAPPTSSLESLYEQASRGREGEKKALPELAKIEAPKATMSPDEFTDLQNATYRPVKDFLNEASTNAIEVVKQLEQLPEEVKQQPLVIDSTPTTIDPVRQLNPDGVKMTHLRAVSPDNLQFGQEAAQVPSMRETLVKENIKLPELVKINETGDDYFGIPGKGYKNAQGREVLIEPKRWNLDAADAVFSMYYYGGNYIQVNHLLRNGIKNYLEELSKLSFMTPKARKRAVGDLIDIVMSTEALDKAFEYLPKLTEPNTKAFKKVWKAFEESMIAYGEVPPDPNKGAIPLYRGLSSRLIKGLKEGDTIKDPAFVSTTPSEYIARRFLKGGVDIDTLEPKYPLLLKIKNHNSARLSTNSSEVEVLFKDATFKIKSIEELPDNRNGKMFIVSVDEVPRSNDTLSSEPTAVVNFDNGGEHTTIQREPLSRDNIESALKMAQESLGYDNALAPNAPFNVMSRSNTNLPLVGGRTEKFVPKTIGEAARNFREALEKINKTGVMDDDTQIALNNAVRAMNTLKDKSYAERMREVVRRLTGRTGSEGKPFMSAAIDLLNDESRNWSRDDVADLVSHAVGTKTVTFAPNMDDAEVLKFGRQIAENPETFSQFDHLYVGHGTGVVEHGTWSLEARPSTGFKQKPLIQHVVDNAYPKGTEVGVAACETGCPKRIHDAVPALHRVVSRGAVQSSLDNLQRLVERLSDIPTHALTLDVLAQYDGMLREALTANKQRSLEILTRMSDLEDDFNKLTKKAKIANEQKIRNQIDFAQKAIEKDLLTNEGC